MKLRKRFQNPQYIECVFVLENDANYVNMKELCKRHRRLRRRRRQNRLPYGVRKKKQNRKSKVKVSAVKKTNEEKANKINQSVLQTLFFLGSVCMFVVLARCLFSSLFRLSSSSMYVCVRGPECENKSGKHTKFRRVSVFFSFFFVSFPFRVCLLALSLSHYNNQFSVEFFVNRFSIKMECIWRCRHSIIIIISTVEEKACALYHEQGKKTTEVTAAAASVAFYTHTY